MTSSTGDPMVGIVVRSKDRPEFLARALKSITAQTLAAWECVIVNDGGDPSLVDALVASLPAHERSRVSVVHSASSRGRWVSANAGVLATSAPLVVLHDDDDSWHPGFLERATDYLERNPDRAGVVSRIEIVWEKREPDGFAVTGREIFQPQLTAPLLSDTLLFNRFVPIGFLYRRRLHEELGLYNDALPVVGDWDFVLRVLTHHPVEYLPGEPLAYWHQRVNAVAADGNSVIAASGDHERTDARLRDDALRQYVQENGAGLVLYLTKFIDRRLVDVENGLREQIIRSSLPRRIARRARRMFGRGT